MVSTVYSFSEKSKILFDPFTFYKNDTYTGQTTSCSKTIAPFGSKMKRFQLVGYHPGFETRPGTFNYPNIFPGCHDWNKPKKIISKVPSWRRCLEVEEFSKRLAFHGDHILKRRIWEKSVNGPGWQDISTSHKVKNIIFSKTERFPEAKKKGCDVPGPGTYGKNHVPHTRMEEKSKAKGFSYSVISPFESAKGRTDAVGFQAYSHLPPNIYNFKSSIEELIEKKVSKRGPYDLYTGPRLPEPTIQKISERKEIVPRRIDPDDLNHPKNLFKGKFLKCGKDALVTTRIFMKSPTSCPESLFYPGPNYYDPYPSKAVVESKYAFNSSTKEARVSKKRGLYPPPGRYNPILKKRIIGDGCRSQFISKTKRCEFVTPKCSWF